jgi:hypothetical protein
MIPRAVSSLVDPRTNSGLQPADPDAPQLEVVFCEVI